jgi:SAM-dependent methyltransferase
MCMTCSTGFDQKTADVFSQRYLGWLNGAGTLLMVSVGHQTRLFDRMAGLPPATSREIADAASLNERYVREWLGAMATAGIVTVDDAGQRFHLPAEQAANLTRGSSTNMATLSQWLAVLGSVESEIVRCFREGGGVPYEKYARFHEVMAEESNASTVAALDAHIIPAAEGLHARLAQGIDVADIGCGSGYAIIHLAKRYPASRFVGLDFSQQAIDRANAAARESGVSNARFEVCDAATWSATDAFDLITAFDAIHDQVHPAKVLANIRSALRDDGVFLMQDIKASSNVAENRNHPIGPFIYTTSCMHCMSVSLSAGGAGLGAAWGWQLAHQMLREAGFDRVDHRALEHDILNDYYICRTVEN